MKPSLHQTVLNKQRNLIINGKNEMLMKRNAIIMLAISSILVSCSKDAVQDSTSGMEDGVYEGAVEMTFSAVTDQTKTSIGAPDKDGNRKISWVEGDEIAILFSYQVTNQVTNQVTKSKAKSSGESTEFDARVDHAEHYYAVYPSSAGSLNGNELTVTIPSTQNISAGFGSAHYAAAVAVDNNFAFKNLCGWIKFTIPEGSEVKRILVRGNGKQPITGNITVTFDKDGNIANYEVSGGNDRLIVDIDGPGEYYAAVLPGMNLENGVGFRFYTDHSTDSGKAISPGVFNPNALSVERGGIKNLGDLTARIVKDWYIAPTAQGTGDGTSEQNAAAGVSFLRNKLAQDQTSAATKNGLAKGYGCIGVTIHAAAGEYDFAGEEILMAWPGHTSLIRTSIEGEDGTVFTNTGESRFFSIGKNVNLKLTGIKVQNGNSDSKGGAVYVSDETALLELESCVFESNSAPTGGALYVAGGLTANATNILSNTATDTGAAIYVSGKSVTRLNNVTITKNQSTNYAAGIYVNSSADVWLNNCSIFGNSNTTEDINRAWGVAILVASAKNATICINNTTIADQTMKLTTGYDTNVDLQGGSLVFANSTMIATSAAGLLRLHTNANNGCFLNSIVINKKGKSINFNGTGDITSQYVISGIPQNKYVKHEGTMDMKNVTHEMLGSPVFDDKTDHVYKWNGSFDGCPAAPAYSIVSKEIQTANPDFYNWLVKLEALDKDALGNSRSNNRQGAYCGN